MSKPISNGTTYASLSGVQPAALLDASFAAPYAAINDVATYTTGSSDTGAADAYVATVPVGVTFLLVVYVRVQFLTAHTNTGGSTLNYNGSGVKSILRGDGTPLNAGDLVAGMLADVMYTGTVWQLMNPASNPTAPASISSAMVLPYFGSAAPTGFVFCNGGSVGNGASGASLRANADTVNLFTALWNALANAQAAVLPSGRGANAAADYAANKTIAVPDLRERSLIGKGDMGATVDPARITLAIAGFNPVTLGVSGGDQNVGSHVHQMKRFSGSAGLNAASAGTTDQGTATGTTLANTSAGAAANIPPGLVCNWVIAL